MNPIELAAMSELHSLWKTATVDKIEINGGDYFFEMEDRHDQLSCKFPKTSNDVVCDAWNAYVKVHSDWMQVILMSRSTMCTLQL